MTRAKALVLRDANHQHKKESIQQRKRAAEKDEKIAGKLEHKQPEARDGDWLCACGNNNFGFRASCHRCHTPKVTEERSVVTEAVVAETKTAASSITESPTVKATSFKSVKASKDKFAVAAIQTPEDLRVAIEAQGNVVRSLKESKAPFTEAVAILTGLKKVLRAAVAEPAPSEDVRDAEERKFKKTMQTPAAHAILVPAPSITVALVKTAKPSTSKPFTASPLTKLAAVATTKSNRVSPSVPTDITEVCIWGSRMSENTRAKEHFICSFI